MKTLGLIFTYGISVQLWHERGLLDREKLIYEKLIEKKIFDKIYWFSYGINDKQYQKILLPQIKVISMPKIFNSKIGKLCYSVLLPLIRKKYFKETAYIKTNQMLGSWTAVLAAKLFKKKLIARTGYTWSIFEKNKCKKRIAIFVEKLLYKNADAIIVSSRNDCDYLEKKYKINSQKLNIIYNYVNTDIFKPQEKIKKYENKLIYIGRIIEQKNLENLIQALQNTPYQLDIYGNGSFKEKLLELSGKLKVKITFTDYVANDRLPFIINQYPLFVLASLYEGMPKSLLEAMACGIACLGTNVAGINEVIQHEKNGWLVEINKESIRQGIIKLMGDENLKKQLGQNARNTIIENFSLENIFNKEILLYEN